MKYTSIVKHLCELGSDYQLHSSPTLSEKTSKLSLFSEHRYFYSDWELNQVSTYKHTAPIPNELAVYLINKMTKYFNTINKANIHLNISIKIFTPHFNINQVNQPFKTSQGLIN